MGGAHSAAGAEHPTTPITAGPRQMAEGFLAVDPIRQSHVAVAADPYLNPTRIVVAQSTDGASSWSQPIEVIPLGLAKSYDPVLAFRRDGTLLIGGGAAGLGRDHCQPASVIFVAVMSRDGIRYITVPKGAAESYVDRPSLAYDSARDVVYLTWTESTGAGAECLAVPRRSSLMYVEVPLSGAPVGVPRPLPTTSAAPYGSAMAFDGQTLVVAVCDRERGRARLVVVSSDDRGRSFSAPSVVADAAEPPAEVPGLGGVFAPIPGLALSPDGQPVVAWSEGVPPNILVSVHQRAGGVWTALPRPGEEAALSVLPQVAYDSAGGLWLLTADLRGSSVAFRLRRWAAGWNDGTVVASGPRERYFELGEALGLGVSEGRVLAAVPVDGPEASSLVIGGTTAPTRPPTTTAARPHTTSPRQPERIAGPVAIAIVAVSTAVLVVVQRRRRRPPRSKRDGATPDSQRGRRIVGLKRTRR